MSRDRSLLSGERQVAASAAGIRADHTARYRWACDVLRESRGRDAPWVLDLGCGVGYGAAMLAEVGGATVVGVDDSEEAVQYARAHYGAATYFVDDVLAFVGLEAALVDGEEVDLTIHYDLVVAFEILEHLKRETALEVLRALAGCSDRLLASVPNELEFPNRGYRFHERHYRPREFEALLNEAGWQVDGWWGQRGPYSPVEPFVSGRTLLADCSPNPNPLPRDAYPAPAVRSLAGPFSIARSISTQE